MALETIQYLSDLDPANPPPNDPKSQGDDHLRGIKLALVNGVLGIAGAVMIGGDSVGAANAYTLIPAKPLIAYTLNTTLVFRAMTANTGACTMNISGLGPRPLRAVNGAELVMGDLVVGQYYVAIATETEFRLAGITKNYIDTLSFGSVLPTPPALPPNNNSPLFLIYQNGVYGYTSTVVPDYLIQAQGVV